MSDLMDEPAPQQPEQARSEIDQISDLLMGKEQDPAPAGDGEGSEPEVPEKDDAKEVVEAEKPAIDYGMKVPMTEGDPVTLGELKDAWQASHTKALEMTERENTILRQGDEVRTLLGYVRDLPPHVIEAAKHHAATDYQRESAALLEAIPEMGTATGVKAVKSALYELAAEYGVSERAVDQIADAATIKMMHDYSVLKKAVKDARANVKPLRTPTAKGKSTQAAHTTELDVATNLARQTGRQEHKIAAIEKLLRA